MQDSISCATPQTAFTPQVLDSTLAIDTTGWKKVQGCFTATGNERFITIGNFSSDAHTTTSAMPGSHAFGDIAYYLFDDISVIETSTKITAGAPSYSVHLGDSVWAGTADEAVPSDWYKGSLASAPIGHGARIWLKGDAVGEVKYYLQMDLCGTVSLDSTILYVYPVDVPLESMDARSITVYPNPTREKLTIEHAAHCKAIVYDLLGQQQLSFNVLNDNETIDIESLASGTYLLQITGETGDKQNLRFVKE